MVERIWTDKYAEGTPADINYDEFSTVLEVFESSVRKFARLPAYTCMGCTITFRELDQYSAAFCSYLQNHTDLKKGDRIAVQMPNLIQFPVAVFGAMRAGLVVVNTNPMYTAREMEHQFNDSGCKGLVVLANFCGLVEKVLPKTGIETLIITEIGDMHSGFKRALTNFVVKYVKKMVPPFHLPNAVPFTRALRLGGRKKMKNTAPPEPDDIAILQYTGGTTGGAKGAMLTHKNVVSNMLQIGVILSGMEEGNEIMITPLPMYHIFSFTVNCLGMMERGCHNVLITNPRDLPAFVNELSKWKFTAITGLNTLFVAMLANEEFRKLDFSALKRTVAGGMALQSATAEEWEEVTGCRVCEGYGMTETSPVISVNLPHANQVGTVGVPLPSTDVKTIDDEGNETPIGESGELCVKGPQVMKGYWQRPDATAGTMTEDGWLKTGDVVVIQEDGFLKIVDRIKDMILVSGFNVYPNEIEDVVAAHPDIVECAAVGVENPKSGEAVKVFVVTSRPELTDKEVIAHCRESLVGYKVPRYVEFRDELPKTNVGKILRRALRDG